MEESCPGCIEAAQTLSESKRFVFCALCGMMLQYKGQDVPCPGCLEVANILYQWSNNKACNSENHPHSEKREKQTIEWMNCAECERIVLISKTGLERLTKQEERAKKLADERVQHRAFLGDIERLAARRDLEHTDFAERLRRIEYYRPRAAMTIHWMINACNPSLWPMLYESTGFGLASQETVNQWLLNLEAGTEAAKVEGKQLINEAIKAWNTSFVAIDMSKIPQSTAGSKDWGRPIILFDLSYTNSPYGVLVTRYLRTRERLLDNH